MLLLPLQRETTTPQAFAAAVVAVVAVVVHHLSPSLCRNLSVRLVRFSRVCLSGENEKSLSFFLSLSSTKQGRAYRDCGDRYYYFLMTSTTLFMGCNQLSKGG